jgi:hypothetical protein
VLSDMVATRRDIGKVVGQVMKSYVVDHLEEAYANIPGHDHRN